MSNIALDRILNQTKNPNIQINPPKVDIIKEENNYIIPSELRKILMESDDKQIIVSEDKNKIKFDGVESFVGWYFSKRENFSDAQNIALSTLIKAREMIYSGCKCKEAHRREQSNEYFKVFWLNNLKTDLLQKVLEVGQFEEMVFSIGENEFLKFPTPE